MLNISGKNRVFKNQYGKYSTSMSKKNAEDKYETVYIPVKFYKCQPPENKSDIIIKKGFLSFYKNDKLEIKNIVIIVEYEYPIKNENIDEELPF